MIRVARLSFLVITFPAVAFAQVDAKQGLSTISAAQGVSSPRDVPTDNQFHSPMVLTLPFPLADRALWGSGKWSEPWLLEQLRDYRCDGVAISGMVMRGALDTAGNLAVEVKGSFDSVRGHDKRVDMKIEFLDGEAVTATAYAYKMKAPENKTRGFKFSLTVPPAVLQTDPATRMRITVSTYDD